MSWPLDLSVNSCVPSNVYDDVPFILKYPTIDQVVECIKMVGPSALLYRVDHEHAFATLVPFSLKFGAAACQMCTDALRLHNQKLWLINYLDDYVGFGPHMANNHFLLLINLLKFVGLPINSKKVEEHSKVMTSLGIEINAESGIVRSSDEKIKNIAQLCRKLIKN